jgi:hypothetical protein
MAFGQPGLRNARRDTRKYLTSALSDVLHLFMSTDANMAQRHGQVLAELSALGLELARDLQARALAADDVAVAADLGRAFHSVSRSVRQTLALEAKLQRDRQRQDREDRAETVRAEDARRQRRKAQVHAAVERCVWNEADGSEAERLLDDLDDWLDAELLSDDLPDETLDAHIARICADLGVTAPAPLAPPLSPPLGKGEAPQPPPPSSS